MMTQSGSTPVPDAGRGSLFGWVICLGLLVVGMVVAGFTMNAGQVWVVPEDHAYSELTHDESVDTWLPANAAQASEFLWYGADVTDDRVQQMTEANADALGLSEAGWMSAEAQQEDVDMVHLQGTVTTTKWIPTKDAEGTLEAGWSTTGEVTTWTTYTTLPPSMTADNRPAGAQFSTNRTIGVWLAALLTLCIMSFLIGDNPFYKTAEALVVGASAAYWMVYNFYTGIVDKLVVGLFPGLVRSWTTPSLSFEQEWHPIYIIPAILSIMLICRLLPKGGWIARWPLAFIIGATAGFRLTSHLESDFLLQIKGTITPLWAVNDMNQFMFWPSLSGIIILVSVLCCLVYFFFSMEHKGVVGKTARAGIYVLMVTFGAAFGLTVMGRITLLTERFDFLFKDWLHLL
jgi:hypothetical protein